MKIWIKSNLRKPPQGKKILCFDNGDISVRQRIKDHWFPIPYTDSAYADIDPPEFWQEIDFPEGFYGYMMVYYQGKYYRMDEWEITQPKKFEELHQTLLEDFEKSRNKEENEKYGMD
jgi:hypothetical protein